MSRVHRIVINQLYLDSENQSGQVSIIAAGIKLAYCGHQHPAACLKLPLCPVYSPEIPCTAIFFHDIYVKYPKFEQ
eukprot:jgi/Picre1/30675/NNA_006036.t1